LEWIASTLKDLKTRTNMHECKSNTVPVLDSLMLSLARSIINKSKEQTELTRTQTGRVQLAEVVAQLFIEELVDTDHKCETIKQASQVLGGLASMRSAANIFESAIETKPFVSNKIATVWSQHVVGIDDFYSRFNHLSNRDAIKKMFSMQFIDGSSASSLQLVLPESLAPDAVVLRVDFDASFLGPCLQSAASTRVVSERVVNIELVTSSSSFSSNRSNAVSQIIFHVESNASDPGTACAWYDHDQRDWSTDGCIKTSRTICNCSHLTEFALVVLHSSGHVLTLDGQKILVCESAFKPDEWSTCLSSVLGTISLLSRLSITVSNVVTLMFAISPELRSVVNMFPFVAITCALVISDLLALIQLHTIAVAMIAALAVGCFSESSLERPRIMNKPFPFRLQTTALILSPLFTAVFLHMHGSDESDIKVWMLGFSSANTIFALTGLADSPKPKALRDEIAGVSVAGPTSPCTKTSRMRAFLRLCFTLQFASQLIGTFLPDDVMSECGWMKRRALDLGRLTSASMVCLIARFTVTTLRDNPKRENLPSTIFHNDTTNDFKHETISHSTL
jgi:hypothetical protein